jgi:hypothetical protein
MKDSLRTIKHKKSGELKSSPLHDMTKQPDPLVDPALLKDIAAFAVLA